MRAAIVACNVAGTFTSATSALTGIRPAVPEHTTLGQFAHDLLGEKRVTGCPLGDRLAQPLTTEESRPEQLTRPAL